MKNHALQMAKAGLPIFPLHSIVDGKCSCGKSSCTSPGKHPRISGGFKVASSNCAVVEQWWSQWPDANIGMPTGQVSGIVVADTDAPEADKWLREIVPQEVLDSALQIKTGKGMHYWFRQPDFSVPNSASGLHTHFDVRGDGGYVVVPPSNHISGTTYEWANEVTITEVGEFPSGLRQLVNGNGKQLEWQKPISSGSRNVDLTRKAGKLIHAGIPAEIVTLTLLELNKKYNNPPLPDADVRTIVGSVNKIDSKKKEHTDFSVITLKDAIRKYGGYETRWAIPGWLPSQTVGLVVAPPSTWKTWILADLAVAVAGGKPFLGKYRPEETGPVLFIQQEDFLPMTLARISTIMGAGLPKELSNGLIEVPIVNDNIPLYLHDKRQLHFEDKDSVKSFIKKVEEIRPKLIVIDPLYAAVPLDDYMSKAAPMLMVLKDLRDEFGCTSLIAHHTKKASSGGRERDELWGSQFVNAWMETGWQMRLTNSDTRVEVTRHFKMAKNPEKIALQFNVDDYSYEVNECEANEKQSPELQYKQEEEVASRQTFNKLMGAGKVRGRK